MTEYSRLFHPFGFLFPHPILENGAMNITDSRLRKTTRSRIKLFGGIGAAIGLALVIFAGVHTLLDSTLEDAIKRGGEQKAKRWLQFFNTQMPELQTLVTTGNPTEDQLDLIESTVQLGEVFLFKLFDSDGRKIIVSDEARFGAEYGDKPNPKATNVFETGISNISINDGTQKPNRPDVYVEAYVQALDADGIPFAVLEVYIDETSSFTLFHAAFDWLAVALPLLCAVIYIAPSIGFLARTAQVRTREQEVDILSRFDVLTGVLNRRTLTAEAGPLFESDRRKRRDVGVLFVDLDKFKAINDENGHEFGDNFLRHISAILSNNLRGTDLVGRIGGDEFVAIMPAASDQQMDSVSRRILNAASTPFSYKGKTLTGSVSIGTHLSPPGQSMDEALHAADLALYHAKHSGRNLAIRYFEGLDTARQRRRRIEARLREALDAGGFELHYQPLHHCQSGDLAGFEALLRLNFDDGEAIPPTEFIPVAEESRMINDIGDLVLRMAVTAAKTWPDHLYVAVNLSPAQFENGTLVDKLIALLDELDFPASRLELEVTESLLLEDEERVAEQLSGLKSMGVSLAMDDFGTGYSSLGYLWRYKFDKLKVDRVFLEGYEFDRDRYRKIIETIIVLGHQMDMQVTVEGVETTRQSKLLKTLHCDQNQGFLLGRPMPADQIKALVDPSYADPAVANGAAPATG